MSSPALTVAVLGTGPLADRLAEKIGARADLELAARLPSTQAPPGEAACVVHVPDLAEIAAGSPKNLLPQLLREGFDVVSAAPLDGPELFADLRDACRAGGSTFHASGAFQATIPARLVRSLAQVSRGIERMEIIEELEVPDTGVYPWNTVRDTGIGTSDADTAAAGAAAVDGYYTAGLRVLDEAVFHGATGATTLPGRSIDVVTDGSGVVERVVVERDLGPALSYRSLWTAAGEHGAPLRYRLVTTSDGGKATTAVDFRFTGGLHPADHLTCVNVLDAIRPVHEHGPGPVRRDLSITRLIPDARLST